MCGICGVHSFAGGEIKTESLPRMMGVLLHRGPDDVGEYHEREIQLGMRRLSIIDVKNGKQPLLNEDKSIVAFQNGEIFNYLELKEELKRKHHVFKYNTDTEVIPHLYEEFGTNFPEKLNGMFGIAVWDKNKKQLCLVRDRLGIKPIYYAEHQGVFYFASEVKALIVANPALGVELDNIAINDYLTLMYVRGERTPFKKIRKLMPGHKLIINENGIKLSRWWNLADHSCPDYGTSLDDAAEKNVGVVK